MTRTLHSLAGGLILFLAVMVVAGLNGRAIGEPANATQPNPAEQGAPTVGDQAAGDDLDALIDSIRNRPLFSADRHAPAPPLEQRQADDQPQVKTAPVLNGRLAGVTLGPKDQKTAVFARPGEKPAVVKEGDEIDGWTVASIEASRVVLSSAFGEKVVEPTVSVAGEGAPPELPFQRKAALAGPPSRPGPPQAPNFGNQAFPNPQLARPPAQQGRPLAASRRN